MKAVEGIPYLLGKRPCDCVLIVNADAVDVVVRSVCATVRVCDVNILEVDPELQECAGDAVHIMDMLSPASCYTRCLFFHG